MTDPTYDARLARLLEDYGRGGVRPVYPADVQAGADFAEQRDRAMEFETEDYK